MRWLAVTLVLLCASGLLVGGVYLRDRDTADWRPPESSLAHTDARAIVAGLDGGYCGLGCGVRSLVRLEPGQWAVRIELNSRPRCYAIDIDHFSLTQRGLQGIEPRAC
jgi:hypothetical protein